ncbi:MAG TPA: sigma-70 family RNA polymerase sigma factor [Polyangiaceae bacterium]|nr:sigma-70 family RNA polymerase sigma factor [Polyangiaceae bacterium]
MYRSESAAVTARLIRTLGGDFALAEEVVQEAFAAALEQWPSAGTPAHPRAWLIQTAQHKAIDRLRRSRRFEAPLEDAERLAAAEAATGEHAATSEQDDYLRLIFTCCHPALAPEAQIALTLRTLCGLSTDEIARAFLVEPVTMAQRLVRAKNKIKVAKIPYVVPERAELAERLDAVLTVIYLVFSEGYAATSGDAWVRRDLSTEAIRLGKLVERLLPEHSEPVALVALMLLHDARRDTRVDANGDLVLLEEQDRSRWDRAQIAEGCERVERALRRGGPTPYALQAAIAALHAQARRAGDTDWPQIVLLYRELLKRAESPVVALNHAAAVAMAKGEEAGLALLADLAGVEELQSYAPFFAARADLLRRLQRFQEAVPDYERSLLLAKNEPEQRYLTRRLAEMRGRIGNAHDT